MKTVREWRGIKDCPVCGGEHEQVSDQDYGVFCDYKGLDQVEFKEDADLIVLYYYISGHGYHRHITKKDK